MMEFAVVRFIDENAPGIVATNWINRRKGTCWFPNVRSEMKQNKLLMRKTTPGNSWLETPIKVLKEFESYDSAKSYMNEVDENSHSDSVSELSSTKRKTAICLSDEDSCSEDESQSVRKKSKNYPAIKFHTTPFFTEPPSTKLSQNQYQVTFSIPVPTPAMIEPTETPGHSRSDTEVSESKTASSSQDYLNPGNDQGIVSDIEQLKTTQTNICNTLAELLNTVKKIDSKVDTLLANYRKQFSSDLGHDVEDMDLVSSMPVGIEDFDTLNDRIKESPSFKQYLRIILKTTGGKDTKALVSNIMRKLINDDVGEKFSLTGKHIASGAVKQAFEKTAIYKLILEVCFMARSDAKENTVREAMSDWLMQSKFRKNRREKRMNSTLPNISYLQSVKDEHLPSDDE